MTPGGRRHNRAATNYDRAKRGGPPRTRIEEHLQRSARPARRQSLWSTPGTAISYPADCSGPGVRTGGGDLPVDLIHVAGFNAWWRATPASVELSCGNAVVTAWSTGHAWIAMPLIGAGHVRLHAAAALAAVRSPLTLLKLR